MPRGEYRKVKSSDWPLLLSKYEQSGLSRGEFCEQEGIRERRFERWEKKLRGAGGKFVEVSSSGSAVEAGAERGVLVELIFPCGTKLQVNGAGV